jgi:putative ABC transport system permease protein
VDARQVGTSPRYESYVVRGLDRVFLEHNTFGLAATARGYGSTKDVWRAMVREPNLAVVDAFVAPRRDNWGFGGLPDFQLEGFYLEDGVFDPISVEVRDPQTQKTIRVTVIGVLKDSAPYAMAGISTSQTSLETAFGDRVRPTVHYFALADGVDPTATAEKLESTFLTNGVEAEAITKVLDEAVGGSRTFNRLIQGFMGLGLVVGVAALGVITARAVVERRQEIGVLRAIGFQRKMVQLSFLLESSFIALTSIALGTLLGLVVSYNVIHDAQQQPSYDNVTLDVPWLNLGVIFFAVYAVALLTTIAPAIRASRVYPAEALRYQ